MAGSKTKRFTALLVFSGLVPASALVAQAEPSCASEVELSSRASVKVSIVDDAGTKFGRYDIELRSKSANLKGFDWTSDTRPTLSIREERFVDGAKTKWLSVNSVSVNKDGGMAFPSWETTFAYNGVEKSSSSGTKTIAYLPELNELASGLDTDIGVLLTAGGAYADDRITLRYSKSDAVSAAKRGAKELDKLVKQNAAGQCSPVLETAGFFMPGCFLTSAACDTIGLADDCWELATLRRFRDEWLAHQPGGADDIATYYAKAPAIANRLRDDPKKLVKLYWTRIVPSALAARIGMKRSARRIYHSMMRDL